MKFRIFFFFGAIVCTTVTAQDKFGKGYYITNEMDTVSGFIQYRSNYTDEFLFRKDIRSQSIPLNTDRVRAFGFSDGSRYEKVDYSKENAPSQVPVFAKVLLTGDINLLSYRNNYVIGSDTKGRYQLVRGKSSSSAQAMKNYQTNTGIFNILFQECPTVKEEAQNTPVNESNVKRLVKEFHSCRGSAFKELNTQKVKGTHFGAFAGVSFINLSFGEPESFSNSSYLYNSKFNTSTQPTIGILGLFSGRQPSSVFALQGELVYSRADFSATNVYTNEDVSDYNIEQTSITKINYNRLSLAAGLRMTLRSNSVNPYFNLGVAGQRFISFDSHVHQTTIINSSVTEEDFELSMSDNSFALWAGAGLKKRITNGYAVFLDVNFESSQISNSGKITALSTRLGFIF